MKTLRKFLLVPLALFVATEAHAMRWYSPSTGRWFSRDPIGERGGLNLYRFADNNPVCSVDRLGRDVFTFLPKDDPVISWNTQSDEEKRNWFKKFENRYGSSINNHAKKYCVPRRLLVAVIAAEMVDYSGWERLRETLFGIGETLGPAQLHTHTAFKENLLPEVKAEYFSGIDGPGGAVTTEQSYYLPIRSSLNDNDQNIEAAARLMNKYLRGMCQASQSGSMSASFNNRIATGCKIPDFCCQTDCKRAVEMKVPKCLVAAMAAQWDFGTRDGVNLWNVPNVLVHDTARKAASHGANAESLTAYINDWW